MFSRIQTAALLAAAAGGPYVASETDWGRSAMGILGDTTNVSYHGGTTAPAYNGASHAHHEVETLRGSDASRYRLDEDLARKLGAIPVNPAAAPTLAGTRVNDLREVIRFDISPDWVIQRFSRVSTVLADLKLEGLRVPIVTGIRADDIAGTLTYYFDHQGKLQRCSFHGFTGDPNKLVQTMTANYGLAAEPALEAGVFTKRWNGIPVHFLRLTHAPVVYSNAVHQKYTVFMELNQPSLVYGISAEARRIVDADRHSGRW
ncbi:DUF6690 family protein [Rubripirellula reticaptiva]|uniref:DUF6690 domain-containing protein n=1 Tax=Rubripirellula reticaptiva TaxID=2528013 RepID=A0A5C6EK03_9BACT|nr:DUF6690 family protein [Rubripirellula reticaptiva]TWU49148.1 hypothetical protein Poly59_37620 [Rubripirellula reticaptiva]